MPTATAATAFAGFPDARRAFWRALARHAATDGRAWFKANKERYERDWVAPLTALLAELRAGIDAAYPYCDLDDPKIFRIYRDVRFGADKTPYKNHIAGRIAIKRSGGVMDTPMALYVHFGPERFAAAGQYLIPPEQLARVRQAIADPARGKELTTLLRRLDKRGYTLRARSTLTRVPRGFPADHPRAHLLKMKGFIVRFPPMPEIATRQLATWLRRECKAVAPLVEWITRASA
jgi:uncharacterized protein (TIGR02453 family)